MSTTLSINEKWKQIRIEDRPLEHFENKESLVDGVYYNVYNFGVLEIYAEGKEPNTSLSKLFGQPIMGTSTLIYKRVNGRVEELLNIEVTYIIQTIAELYLYDCNFVETKNMFNKYFLG